MHTPCCLMGLRRSTNQATGGIVIFDLDGRQIKKKGFPLKVTSNNEAKYGALSEGLRIYLSLNVKRLNIKGDALLVIKQVLGIWKTKHSHLKTWLYAVKRLLGQLKHGL